MEAGLFFVLSLWSQSTKSHRIQLLYLLRSMEWCWLALLLSVAEYDWKGPKGLTNGQLGLYAHDASPNARLPFRLSHVRQATHGLSLQRKHSASILLKETTSVIVLPELACHFQMLIKHILCIAVLRRPLSRKVMNRRKAGYHTLTFCLPRPSHVTLQQWLTSYWQMKAQTCNGRRFNLYNFHLKEVNGPRIAGELLQVLAGLQGFLYSAFSRCLGVTIFFLHGRLSTACWEGSWLELRCLRAPIFRSKACACRCSCRSRSREDTNTGEKDLWKGPGNVFSSFWRNTKSLTSPAGIKWEWSSHSRTCVGIYHVTQQPKTNTGSRLEHCGPKSSSTLQYQDGAPRRVARSVERGTPALMFLTSALI